VPVATPAPAPIPTPPAPVTANTNVNALPGDVSGAIARNGEQIVGALAWGAGPAGAGWWFGSKGGVFAVGGAPFHGSAVGAEYRMGLDGGRRIVAYGALGANGYQLRSNFGETYNFS
jgi:hypothetical protein